MVVHAKAQAAREAVDGALEVAVVEGNDPPAGVAQEMMVVLASRVDGLVANGGVPELEASDEATGLEQVQDAIDARAAYPLALAGVQVALDLLGGEGAALRGQQVDERVASGPAAMARLLQDGPSMIGPLGAKDFGHEVQSNRRSRGNENQAHLTARLFPRGGEAADRRRHHTPGRLCAAPSPLRRGVHPVWCGRQRGGRRQPGSALQLSGARLLLSGVLGVSIHGAIPIVYVLAATLEFNLQRHFGFGQVDWFALCVGEPDDAPNRKQLGSGGR